MIHDSISRFNEAFCNSVMERCKNQKVLLLLSGGMDTRVLLSVFARYRLNIECLTYNAVVDDIKIAKRLSSMCSNVDNHYIWTELEPLWDDNRKRLYPFFKNYTVVLVGVMLWSLDRFDNINYSEDGLQQHYQLLADWCHQKESECSQLYFPMFEESLLKLVREIPLKYRYFRYLQRCMVQLNYPQFLSVKSTHFNMRKRLGRLGYWSMLRVIR
jgi:hypothetical protein